MYESHTLRQTHSVLRAQLYATQTTPLCRVINMDTKLKDVLNEEKLEQEEWDRDTKLLDEFVKNYPQFAPKYKMNGEKND